MIQEDSGLNFYLAGVLIHRNPNSWQTRRAFVQFVRPNRLYGTPIGERAIEHVSDLEAVGLEPDDALPQVELVGKMTFDNGELLSLTAADCHWSETPKDPHAIVGLLVTVEDDVRVERPLGLVFSGGFPFTTNGSKVTIGWNRRGIVLVNSPGNCECCRYGISQAGPGTFEGHRLVPE